MKRKSLWFAISSLMVLGLAVSAGIVARAEDSLHLSGLINGYSPATVNPVGPWEIRGHWSLTVHPYSQTADFSADLTMERTDLWVLANKQDPDSTALRMSHTHHIEMDHVPITAITNGFELKHIATITKDGSPAPFSPAPLTVDFTGGTSLLISNVALTFGTGADLHFGSVPILGVVGKP
jgi:hypothetical protein